VTVSKIQMCKGGPEVSRIALGLWRLADHPVKSPQDTLEILHKALEVGITTIDQADIYGDYGSEEILGKALSLQPSIREKLQIVTKCGIKLISSRRPFHKIKSYDTSREHIKASVDASLKAIQTDYINLLLIHRPDPLMDPVEISETFDELKKAGKVLHFGVSNFTPSQFDLIQSQLDFPLVTNQIQLSVQHYYPLTDGTLDHCIIKGISPMAWSPLGGGQLFQKVDETTLRIQNILHEVKAKHQEASIDQVLLAWLLKHPSKVIPVIGTGNLDRIVSAAGAEQIYMSREEWFEIWAASMGKSVP
jgi:predicted oxidoreductase